MRSMSVGSGLVQETTHLMLGDYRLVKTLGVGAFGKVKRKPFVVKFRCSTRCCSHTAGVCATYYSLHAVCVCVLCDYFSILFFFPPFPHGKQIYDAADRPQPRPTMAPTHAPLRPSSLPWLTCPAAARAWGGLVPCIAFPQP